MLSEFSWTKEGGEIGTASVAAVKMASKENDPSDPEIKTEE